ncbi:oocyte zinc finger protein XlCOF6-like [Dendroctonus ponderosae]|uniref:oocyte zinc finger protein XlCOF6-like n=1 Tax=Dendroctonus ponderosae TaxID=77166 RepID=UPI00203507D0|nr:oocyte zinc finger protein XlCOF6-like [Dendroctonus ponderosae]
MESTIIQMYNVNNFLYVNHQPIRSLRSIDLSLSKVLRNLYRKFITYIGPKLFNALRTNIKFKIYYLYYITNVLANLKIFNQAIKVHFGSNTNNFFRLRIKSRYRKSRNAAELKSQKVSNQAKPARYSCSTCDKNYSSRTFLAKHRQQCGMKNFEAPKRRPYRVPRECSKCSKTFLTVKELKMHQKQHGSLEPDEEHTYQHDEESDLYICQTCSAEFQFSSEAEKHITVHKQQNFACLRCTGKFKSLRALFCHMENHPEANKIPCPMCSFKADTTKKLLSHLTSSHMDTNVCQKCEKTFNNRANFRKHMLRHDETKKTTCIVCKNMYFGAKALLRHQICMHKADILNDPSLLWCNTCRMEFKTLNLLKYHIDKAHIKKQTKTVEKKCLCDICGQGFKDSDNLKKHKISHTEHRPFECKECGKAFKHKYVLTYHERIHTGERPYTCGYCAKNFRQWTPYKVHLRGHTGEKPYVCKLCSKGFTTNQGLKLHIKSCFNTSDNEAPVFHSNISNGLLKAEDLCEGRHKNTSSIQ